MKEDIVYDNIVRARDKAFVRNETDTFISDAIAFFETIVGAAL